MRRLRERSRTYFGSFAKLVRQQTMNLRGFSSRVGTMAKLRVVALGRPGGIQVPIPAAAGVPGDRRSHPCLAVAVNAATGGIETAWSSRMKREHKGIGPSRAPTRQTMRLVEDPGGIRDA